MRMKIFVNGKETTALLDSEAVRANIVSEPFVKSLERSSSHFIPIITSTARLRLGDNTFSNKTVNEENISEEEKQEITRKFLSVLKYSKKTKARILCIVYGYEIGIFLNLYSRTF
jgi:hypothetical protein